MIIKKIVLTVYTHKGINYLFLFAILKYNEEKFLFLLFVMLYLIHKRATIENNYVAQKKVVPQK